MTLEEVRAVCGVCGKTLDVDPVEDVVRCLNPRCRIVELPYGHELIQRGGP